MNKLYSSSRYVIERISHFIYWKNIILKRRKNSFSLSFQLYAIDNDSRWFNLFSSLVMVNQTNAESRKMFNESLYNNNRRRIVLKEIKLLNEKYQENNQKNLTSDAILFKTTRKLSMFFSILQKWALLPELWTIFKSKSMLINFVLFLFNEHKNHERSKTAVPWNCETSCHISKADFFL